MLKTLLAALLLAAPAAAQPGITPEPYVQLTNAPWTRQAVIYQINTRQFTPEGTFRAAQRELPRLKALGVDILWLMPIHPIGEKNRKGTLGSPYSVRDYYGVNPEFGTPADFKAFVDAAHKQGMKVILDWVANHSAWDNKLLAEYPDWYDRDLQGNARSTPWFDWDDIIDFDFSKPGVRRYMADALVHWVRDYGVDGYRFDVAGLVPLDFWEGVRPRLEAVRPVFLLGEWEQRDLHRRALDATYAWSWWDAAHRVALGRADATGLYGYFATDAGGWPREAMRMVFTENHDKNAWEGTQYEAFGPNLPAMLALQFTGVGMPALHNGQEACNARRLKFFEKDPIAWRECDLTALIRDLIAFRKAHPVLDNGRWGGAMLKVDNDRPKEVFSYLREGSGQKLFAAMNLSAAPVTVTFPGTLQAGDYREFRGGTVRIAAGERMTLPAHGFRLFATGPTGRLAAADGR